MKQTIPLKPKFARVVLRREKMKHSSILLPDGADKRHAPAKGVVVAVGPDADENIAVGMTVIHGRHAGAWINADGTLAADEKDAEFYILLDEDILAEVAA